MTCRGVLGWGQRLHIISAYINWYYLWDNNYGSVWGIHLCNCTVNNAIEAVYQATIDSSLNHCDDDEYPMFFFWGGGVGGGQRVASCVWRIHHYYHRFFSFHSVELRLNIWNIAWRLKLLHAIFFLCRLFKEKSWCLYTIKILRLCLSIHS